MARFAPGGERLKPHQRDRPLPFLRMAPVALHARVRAGEYKRTLASMIKGQDLPTGGLVTSAAICPAAGGELCSVELFVAALTARRSSFVLRRLNAGTLPAHVTGRAFYACMLADKLEARPGMIEIHW